MTGRPPIGRFYELQQEVSIPEDYVLTSKIKIKAPTRKQMLEFRLTEDPEVADKALLGPAYDDVVALYQDRPEQEWAAFAKDIWSHFFGLGAADVEGKSGESSE